MARKKLATTVGELRELIKDLPDSTPIYPDWASGFSPDESDPSVEIDGLTVVAGSHKQYLSVKVRLCPLDN